MFLFKTFPRNGPLLMSCLLMQFELPVEVRYGKREQAAADVFVDPKDTEITSERAYDLSGTSLETSFSSSASRFLSSFTSSVSCLSVFFRRPPVGVFSAAGRG